MFKINEDLTIECTRGDAAVFTVGASVDGAPYQFREGDVVRFTVCTKKDYSSVVLQKDVTVTEATEAVEICLDSADTKIGDPINKPDEYWYEVELNPETFPQTIIGHTEDGAKAFMLYPEGVRGDNNGDITGTLSGKNSMSGSLGVIYGKDGKSAYEVAVKNGFEGAEEEWLASLVGEKGDQGEQGPKGDKGDAGVIDFIVVTELPADGDGSKIYLVPNATGENNNFDEYIFQDGQWEKIGSAGVQVNLDEYVKNTDFASAGKPGVVMVYNPPAGIGITGSGYLYLNIANNAKIDGKTDPYSPIVPSNLDYAVKKGLADNKLEWTEEEKTAARELLGTVNSADVKEAAFALSIPIRDGGGRVSTQAPIADLHAANKGYVDSNFVQKQTSDRTSVYAVNKQGEQILVGTCSNAANSGMIPIYNKNGTINIATPETPTQAANKGYVDEQIAALLARIEALEGKQ